MDTTHFRTTAANRPVLYKDATKIPNGASINDTIDTTLRELYYIENPQIDKRQPHDRARIDAYIEDKKMTMPSVYAYYPRYHAAVRIPEEETYYAVRTARNRNLILPDEQDAFRRFTVGIAGLSVGSAVAAHLVQSGGPKRMKFADHDTVELSNLNRMRATLLHIGMNKAEVAAELAWELDPFSEIEIWDSGISEESLPDFFCGDHPLQAFVDEMDSIPLKLAARIEARKRRIPVVMATDNGDSAIVDIERFDLEPERELFHGRVTENDLSTPPQTAAEFNAMVNKIVDPQFFTKRQLASVAEIGKTLSGVAQIATAANISGAAVAYVIRQIAHGDAIPSGRYLIGCDAAFIATAES